MAAEYNKTLAGNRRPVLRALATVTAPAFATLVVSPTLIAMHWGMQGGSAGHLHGSATSAASHPPTSVEGPSTATPIKHVVVNFQENRSFDHYFGTYPHAKNPPGEPRFVVCPGTPSVNGLTETLLAANPNLANPQRLDRADELVCIPLHQYDPEQRAWHGGLLDRFVQETSGSTATGVIGPDCKTPLPGHTHDQATNKLVMDYYARLRSSASSRTTGTSVGSAAIPSTAWPAASSMPSRFTRRHIRPSFSIPSPGSPSTGSVRRDRGTFLDPFAGAPCLTHHTSCRWTL